MLRDVFGVSGFTADVAERFTVDVLLFTLDVARSTVDVLLFAIDVARSTVDVLLFAIDVARSTVDASYSPPDIPWAF
ncbi:hypothetical protein F3157_19075 [Virgibacillus dakarensis]|nr:hypothetical protein [Virgibacillus dakarensis]